MEGSVASQHVLYQVAKRAPEVLTTGQMMLVDEEDIMLETRVEMRLQAKMHNHRIMVTVYMGVDSVKALEELANELRKRLGKGNT